MKIESWEELEDFVKSLLDFDDSSKPKGSGSAKKEEDIVSQNIIAQCKFTSNKNITILEKDMDRLLSAQSILSKIPVFVNKSDKMLTFTIPYSEETADEIEKMMEILAVSNGIKYLLENRSLIKDYSILAQYEKTYNKVKKQFVNMKNSLKENLEKLESFIDEKHVSLSTYDLFENGH